VAVSFTGTPCLLHLAFVELWFRALVLSMGLRGARAWARSVLISHTMFRKCKCAALPLCTALISPAHKAGTQAVRSGWRSVERGAPSGREGVDPAELRCGVWRYRDKG
jgi:hypothetical protein